LDHLAAILDRKPTVAELAELLDLSESDVIEGLVAANGYTAGSLDLPNDSTTNKSRRTFADTMGGCDPAMELVEDFSTLAPSSVSSTTVSAASSRCASARR
jgi:RNA polymerase sigma-B factor